VFANGSAKHRVQLSQPSNNPRLAALNTAARELADYQEFIRTVTAL
jgi:hypothetical protein